MACSICGGSGKIPLKRYKYGFMNCNCHESPIERFQPLDPDTIDFPCSRDFRRFYETQGGRPDPGDTAWSVESPPREQVIVHRHSDMGELEADLLQQMARKVANLERKLAGTFKGRYQEYSDEQR